MKKLIGIIVLLSLSSFATAEQVTIRFTATVEGITDNIGLRAMSDVMSLAGGPADMLKKTGRNDG